MPSAARSCRVLVVVAALATAGAVHAQAPSAPSTPPAAAEPAKKAAPQGVAVLASRGAREEAFVLARAVYRSSLRPRGLDELRARILAGDPAPAAASKEVKELAELRASVGGEDVASRKLLSSIAQQLGVQALLVVSRVARPSEDVAVADAGAAVAAEDAGVAVTGDAGPAVAAGDAGVADVTADAGVAEAAADAGVADRAPPATPAAVARLFLADTGDFDAARYEPDPEGGWQRTVTSLARRFPSPPVPAIAQPRPMPAPTLASEGKETKPFYASPWFWGAIGAAVLIGGFFYFASQDTSDDPIHLQMKVPR